MSNTGRYTLGYILKGYPRISETFITNEILALEQLGYRIKIYSLRLPYDAKVHPNVAKVKAEVVYLPEYIWKQPLDILVSNLATLVKHPVGYLRSLGFATIRSVKRLSYHTFKRFLQAGYLVYRYYRNGEIQHWHAHFAHGPTTTAMFVSWMTGVPFSFTAHAKDIYTQAPDFITKKLKYARFAVTCTGYNLTYLQSLNRSQTPIYRNYHGIDLTEFRNGVYRPELSEPVRILTVGRLVEKKGYPVLLRALQLLKQQGIAFRSRIVGSGPLKKQLQMLRDELGLQEEVQFLGQMSQREVKVQYQEADLFVLSPHVASDGDRDGIPNVLVEAMAMRIPVISTRISGIPELIRDGENGILVEPEQPEQLAGAMAELIRKPQVRQQLVENAVQTVQELFDFHRNTRRLGELFDQAVNAKPQEAHGTEDQRQIVHSG